MLSFITLRLADDGCNLSQINDIGLREGRDKHVNRGSKANNFLRPVPCSFLFAFKLVIPDYRNPNSDPVETEQVALDPIEFSRSRPIEHQSRSDCCQVSRRRAHPCIEGVENAISWDELTGRQ